VLDLKTQLHLEDQQVLKITSQLDSLRKIKIRE